MERKRAVPTIAVQATDPVSNVLKKTFKLPS